MNEVKTIWQSKTVLGIVVSVIGKLAATYFGVTVDEESQTQLASVLSLLVSGVGDVIALYGRIKATKKIV